MDIEIQFQKDDFVVVDGVLKNYNIANQCPLSRAVDRVLDLINRREFSMSQASTGDDPDAPSWYKAIFENHIAVMPLEIKSRVDASNDSGESIDIDNDQVIRQYSFDGALWNKEVAQEQGNLFIFNPNHEFSIVISGNDSSENNNEEL